MIDIYKTKSIKQVKGLNSTPLASKPTIAIPARQESHQSIHQTVEGFSVPDSEDIYASSLNKLKLKEYIFEFFDISRFVKHLIFTFGLLFVVRYLGMLIAGYFLSGSPLLAKVYFGFLPVFGYNVSSEVSNQINVASIFLTAIIPTLILIINSFGAGKLTTVPRAFELVFKEVNFLDFGSGIYKDTIKQIQKFVPKYFYEFVLVWYVAGFFGILQYLIHFLVQPIGSDAGFGWDFWKLIGLVFINTWIVLVWNKKVREMRKEWDYFVNEE